MKYLKVWTSLLSIIQTLEDDEIGRLFRMMLIYAESGEEPEEFSGNERFLWPVVKRDIDMMEQKSETMRENGLKGGRPKKQPEAEESKKNLTKANESDQKPKEKERKEKESKEKEDQSFDRFWTAYPRKEAKQNAKKAFDKIAPDESLLTLMLESVEAWKRSEQWQEDGGRFIPHPATWLNQRRWEDKPPAAGRKVVNAQDYTQRNYSAADDMDAFLRGLA